jgi:endo-1,4-beta-D-glucanase Y
MVNNIARLLLVIFVLASAGCSPPVKNEMVNSWIRYQALFVDNGRVVDTGNEDVSHSEGQGYALLFALAANDSSSFDEIWRWTQKTLQREDKLFHWRFKPCSTMDKACIDDPNNASDGEILIAWALLRASKRWQNQEYRTQALLIIESIEENLIVNTEAYTLLLPGLDGFISTDKSIHVNLSYWIFPALRDFADVGDTAIWQSLFESGKSLIANAKFSAYSLPPDWLKINNGELSLSDTLATDYGFNACRIPLHLIWGEIDESKAYLPFLNLWLLPMTPATIELKNDTFSSYQYTQGMQAIASSVSAKLSNTDANLPIINRKTDYYSASLILLSKLTLMDISK